MDQKETKYLLFLLSLYLTVHVAPGLLAAHNFYFLNYLSLKNEFAPNN